MLVPFMIIAYFIVAIITIAILINIIYQIEIKGKKKTEEKFLLVYNPDYGYPQLIDIKTKEVVAETSNNIIDYLYDNVWCDDVSKTLSITEKY